MIDIQLEHGTNCSLPSARFPGEPGWYVYLGEDEGTEEGFVDLSASIAAGKGVPVEVHAGATLEKVRDRILDATVVAPLEPPPGLVAELRDARLRLADRLRY